MTSRAASGVSAASTFGRRSRETAAQSNPPNVGSGNVSLIVCQTVSNEAMAVARQSCAAGTAGARSRVTQTPAMAAIVRTLT